jgi:hypothetical protein
MRPSIAWRLSGRSMALSSLPVPLCPRLRPVKSECTFLSTGADDAGLSSEWPKLNMLFFFSAGLASSFKPTSSNPSSAGPFGRSMLGLVNDDRGTFMRRESRLCRGNSTDDGIGERAEMSYKSSQTRTESLMGQSAYE